MSNVYMLNLGFTLLAGVASNGSFTQYQTGQSPLQTSSAWLKLSAGSLPPWATDNCQLLSQNMGNYQWNVYQQDWTPSTPYLTCNAGDFVLIRIYPADNPQPMCKVRFSAVFGQGSDTPTQGNVVQSPLQMSPGVARSMIAFPDPGPANYQLPVSLDGSWTYLLGQLHTLATYSVNVGVNVYNTVNGNLFALGHDPTMKVVGNVPASAVA